MPPTFPVLPKRSQKAASLFFLNFQSNEQQKEGADSMLYLLEYFSE